MAVVSTNTSPFGDRFSVAPPPLTPKGMQIYSARRRLAERNLKVLREDTVALAGEAEAQNIFTRSRLREDIARQLRQGLGQTAARGLGTSPMFAGRMLRESARFQQQEEAQMEMNFTNRLNELQRALMKGELERDRELLSIASEEAAARMAAQLALAGA